MSAGLETRFTREYGLEHPIAQAAMAFVGTAPDLAIAVCRAGAVGSIAVGPLPAEAARSLIRAVRSATDRPLNVTFMTFLATPEQVEVCCQERVPIVSFHWGHPSGDFVGPLAWRRSKGLGAGRIARGGGGGRRSGRRPGHRSRYRGRGHNYGALPTFVLVPSILEAVAPVPVLAAGGVSTGRQLAAALALGADGVWVGTRLVASQEAFAHEIYKRRLVEAASTQTRLTSVYGPNMPQFNPMRVLDAGLARDFAGREDQAPKDLESQPLIGSMRLGPDEADDITGLEEIRGPWRVDSRRPSSLLVDPGLWLKFMDGSHRLLRAA